MLRSSYEEEVLEKLKEIGRELSSDDVYFATFEMRKIMENTDMDAGEAAMAGIESVSDIVFPELHPESRKNIPSEEVVADICERIEESRLCDEISNEGPLIRLVLANGQEYKISVTAL